MLRKVVKSMLRRRDEADLESELSRLEEEARAPALDFRAAVLSRAGDLCVDAGQIDRALGFYGRAIDGYLGLGYYASAMALCEKVIGVAPGVVRTRCTLAFLLLGEDLPYLTTRGVSEETRRHLEAYVEAARTAGKGSVAVQRLRMMAEVTEIEPVRRLLADLLLAVGEEDAADVHHTLLEECADAAESHPERARNQRQRWAEMLRVAIMGEPASPGDQQSAAENA